MVNKFRFDHGKACRIAAYLIPPVLHKFVHKNDSNDNSFDLKSIMERPASGSGWVVFLQIQVKMIKTMVGNG